MEKQRALEVIGETKQAIIKLTETLEPEVREAGAREFTGLSDMLDSLKRRMEQEPDGPLQGDNSEYEFIVVMLLAAACWDYDNVEVPNVQS